MCNYSSTVLERGIVQGIVKTCERYHIPREEMVDLVMKALDYDMQDAQEIIRQYDESRGLV